MVTMTGPTVAVHLYPPLNLSASAGKLYYLILVAVISINFNKYIVDRVILLVHPTHSPPADVMMAGVIKCK